jgi:hypothetical protein
VAEYCEVGQVDDPIFIGSSGVKAFLIPGTTDPVDMSQIGGPSAEKLLPELAKGALSSNRAGLVSLTAGGVLRTLSRPTSDGQ